MLHATVCPVIVYIMLHATVCPVIGRYDSVVGQYGCTVEVRYLAV